MWATAQEAGVELQVSELEATDGLLPLAGLVQQQAGICGYVALAAGSQVGARLVTWAVRVSSMGMAAG